MIPSRKWEPGDEPLYTTAKAKSWPCHHTFVAAGRVGKQYCTNCGVEQRPVRPLWGETVMDLAELLTKRATCPRAQVGAVITIDRRIIATGYNGAPTGAAHCLQVGCLMDGDHCVRSVHAEANAIAQLARFGVATGGAAQLWTTHSPCLNCAGLIVQAGIEAVVYKNVYGKTIDKVRELLVTADISIREFYTRQETTQP